MKSLPSHLVAAALLAAAASRAPAEAQAPRPGAAPAAPAPAASPAPRRAAAPVDARFVRGMLAHHAQALAMTALVPARSASADVRLLAERIEVSQRDEIAAMRRWLEDHGAAAPAADSAHAPHHAAGAGQAGAGHHAEHAARAGHDSAHAAHDADDHAGHDMAAGMAGMTMPGMLTAAELARLAGARGAAFDRLFLEYMVRHHEGALTMVAELFAAPGAAQEAQLFGVASDVDADQRAEIRRMRALLGTLGTPAAAPRAPSSSAAPTTPRPRP